MQDNRKENREGPEWDWLRFEQWMSRAFPFLKEDLELERLMRSPFPVGKVVQEALDRSFGSGMLAATGKPAWSARIRSDMFETHRSVIVRLHLPAGVRKEQVRTLVSRHKLRVEWPPDFTHDILLNHSVNPKRARAGFKDGILEVRMPKTGESFYEL